MMRIAVYGVGAVGSVIGANLLRAGYDVVLVEPWRDHAEAMKANGLRVTQDDDEVHVRGTVLRPDELSKEHGLFDVIVVSVKSYDTVQAVKTMQPYLAPGGYFVSAQNSLNEEQIVRVAGEQGVVGAVVTFGAVLAEPGHAVRTAPVKVLALTLGEVDGSLSPRLEALKATLEWVGPIKLTTNLWGERWSKLTTNCMVNAIAGVTGYGSREVRQVDGARRVAVRIGAEVVQVGEAEGVSIEPILGGVLPRELLAAARGEASPAEEKLIAEGGQRGEGKPSLLQDIYKGRKTEIDYLNGLVVRKGREVGIATPWNAVALELVRLVEAGRLPTDPANLERFRAVRLSP